ncbi:hypothetical protein C2857_006646 [Epichloe festucae Fl1]|uniref:DUF8004 domain-containing protein n=1 Tax=Epichloe festucae (strain Fl1) TaxID=877507 RepID=A0A7S9KTS4_EPIFF|nr:hypothetical protein C2857_006646 [Epichloe festucae Fl1]
MTPRPWRSPGDVQKWYRANPKRTVELFIPPPQNASDRQRQRHHVLMRNFFAWVLGKSLVGETLGEALVGLLECMHEYRPGGTVDNVADLIRYLEEEGYLCLAGQPDHALAILRLAETFRFKDLYLQALAHCVGMGDMTISGKADFQHMSLATRRLMHDCKDELDLRLKKTTDMLKSFLDQELSESELGIPTGIRVHLERFRSFLLSFYSTKLGYYPPVRFDGCIYRAMARDFTALYNLLVDDGYNSSEAMPSVAVGGICTLQLVQSFDTRNGFDSMKHPLPKLPHQDHRIESRRSAWLLRKVKQRNNDRQLNHVSLVQASNWNKESFENSLVKAYRRFEEECATSPRKLDRRERISLVDGRKIRWILIYAVHQTLQNAAQRPPGVPDDPKAAYVVSVARHTKVPWQDDRLPGGIPRSQTEPALTRLTEQLEAQKSDCAAAENERFEIKPDIDYFALTHKEDASIPSRSRRASLPADSHVVLQRTNSTKQALNRSFNIRRSMRRLQKTSPPPAPLAPTAIHSHHEIVVHGYGNGTNQVYMESDAVMQPGRPRPTVLASRSASTASETGSSNISTVPSSASMADTLESSLNSPILSESPLEMPTYTRRRSHQDSSSVVFHTTASSPPSIKRRPMSTALDGGYSYAARAFGHFMDQDRRGMFGPNRQSSASDLERSGSFARSRPIPLPIQEDGINEEPHVVRRDSGDWSAMQAFLDGKGPDEAGDGISDAWAQYADLGGLTEMR